MRLARSAFSLVSLSELLAEEIYLIMREWPLTDKRYANTALEPSNIELIFMALTWE
jgi:hypothetical protein